MEPVDFIQDNVEKQLKKDGYSSYIATSCAREAVRMYKGRSHFNKGKVFDEVMKRAKSQAKMMGRAIP